MPTITQKLHWRLTRGVPSEADRPSQQRLLHILNETGCQKVQKLERSASGAEEENAVLEKYKYKQELKRTIKLFGSFAVAFSIISPTTGIFQNYGFVLTTVGPLGIWTFPVVGLGSLVVALIFSEIASLVPLTGQCYAWVTKLVNPGLGWLVGWINCCYTVVILTSVDASLAPILSMIFNVPLTPQFRTLTAVAAITVQLLFNVFSVKLSTLINNAAVVTESGGILLLTIVLVIAALRNNAPVSNMTAVNPSLNGQSLLAPLMMSSLMGFYTLVSFESAANMSDETKSASKNVPKAMLLAVGLSTLCGTLFLAAATWSIKDLSAVEKSGAPMPYLIESSLGNTVGKLFLVVVFVSVFACGLVSLTNSSRTIYAMSRDNAFFFSNIFKKVNHKTSTPVFACILVWAVGTLFLTNTTPDVLAVASAAMPSIYYIITIISYLTVRKNQKFSENHFNLGKLGVPIMILALLWLFLGLGILSIPKQFLGGTIVNLSLCAAGVVFYFAWFRRRIQNSET